MVKQSIFYFLIATSIIFEFYFGIIAGVGFIIQVILLALLFTLVSSYFSRDKTLSFLQRVRSYSFRILAILGFFLWIPLSFILYYSTFPGKISDITLSNGSQKVVFLSMSHIATREFYAKKQSTLRELSASGYTILVEGVSPGTPENQTRFDNALGIELNQDLYAVLSLVAGLEVQSGGLLFSTLPEDTLQNVDMSLDEIVELMGTGSRNPAGASGAIDMGEQLDLISKLPPQEQQFIRAIFRSFLNWSIVNMTDIEHLTNAENKELFDIILHRRNDRVVSYIRENPTENIAIVYGALHFSGILESLRKIDPNWKIESYTSDTPYSD